MVLKRFFLTFLCLGIVFFNCHITASFERYLLKDPVGQDAFIYDHFLFGKAKGGFSRYDLRGKLFWQLSDLNQGSSYLVHFDRLFVIEEGQLRCFDAKYGGLQWTFFKKSIRSVFPIFPYLYCFMDNGTVVNLDFFSGDVLWTFDTIKGSNTFKPVGHSLYLALIKGSMLYLVDRIDHSIYLKQNLGFQGGKIESSWNRGLCFSVKERLYVFDLFDQSVRHVKQNLFEQAVWFDEYHYVFFDSKANSVHCFNVDSDQLVWTISPKNPIQRVVFGESNMLLVFESSFAKCFSFLNGQEVASFERLPFDPMDLISFTISKSHFNFVSSNDIYAVLKNRVE